MILFKEIMYDANHPLQIRFIRNISSEKCNTSHTTLENCKKTALNE